MQPIKFHNMSHSEILQLLSAEQWIWARTMPGIPHEYIVRGRCRMTEAQFESIVAVQRQTGRHEVWGHYNFSYLYVDGYKYWTMGDPIQDTIILNRQKVFSEYDALDEIPIETACDKELIRLLNNWYQGENVLDAGCGTGKFLELLAVPKERYRGCDPSHKSINTFKQAHPGYNVISCAFEECYKSWINTNEAIVALNGSPSYIMMPYLKMLAASNRRFFLMFYKAGYKPKGFEATHAFEYGIGLLKGLFTECSIVNTEHYIIMIS
jgi:SAM-dependent methyltransferase